MRELRGRAGKLPRWRRRGLHRRPGHLPQLRAGRPRISLPKVLLTILCLYDCHYRINRRSSNVRRAAFTAEEVAKLTLDFYKRNYIGGRRTRVAGMMAEDPRPVKPQPKNAYLDKLREMHAAVQQDL